MATPCGRSNSRGLPQRAEDLQKSAIEPKMPGLPGSKLSSPGTDSTGPAQLRADYK